MTRTNESIKATVKEKYGKRALNVVEGSSCCGGGDCDPITQDLYAPGELGGIPEEAVRASLGCGNRGSETRRTRERSLRIARGEQISRMPGRIGRGPPHAVIARFARRAVTWTGWT